MVRISTRSLSDMYLSVEQAEAQLSGNLSVSSRPRTWALLTLLSLVSAGVIAWHLGTTVQALSERTAGRGEEDGIMQAFASWQDWGSPVANTKPFKNLREALDMEHQAWEMTRQETCSWEAGLQVPPEPMAWGRQSAGTEARCSKLLSQEGVEHHLEIACWESLKLLACSAGHEKLSWDKAKSVLEEKAQVSLKGATPPLDDASLCDVENPGSAQSWTSFEKQKSLAWLAKNVQAFVLAVPGATATSALMLPTPNTSQLLGEFGIQATRIKGYDLSRPEDLQAAKLAGHVPKDLKTPPRNAVVKLNLIASHFHIQDVATQPGLTKPITLVLEDGMQPSRDFQLRLWSLITEEAPCDWDFISLSSRCPLGRCVAPHLVRLGPEARTSDSLSCDDPVNSGFQGVLYRTGILPGFKSRWKEIAFDQKHFGCLGMDMALSVMADEVAAYAVPAVQDPSFIS